MKIRSQIFLVLLLLTGGVAFAQNQAYEYADVTFGRANSDKPTLFVSFSNGEFKEIEIDKKEFKSSGNSFVNQTYALKYIADMSKEGWEAISYNSTADNHYAYCTYFLKRKLKSDK